MKRLLLLLLLSVPSFAACSITVFVSGTPILSAPVNANFASLNTCKPQVFSGTTLPGNIAGSKLGDLYLNTTSGLSYQCFKTSGVCTAVAAANWVQIGGGGGGSGTVTVVSSGSLTSTACVTGGGTTTIQTGTGCTISSTGDMVAHSYASSDTTHSGGSLYNGLTSGAVMLAAADVAGTAIVYVLPSTNGTSGQFLKDNGVVACPTLAAGSPSVCHQLTWASGGGGGTIPSTTSTLKGDGAGNALAVTGTGTDCVLVNGSSGACGSGSGTVTSIGTTSPITGGTITTTGTIACASCVTSSTPGAGVAHFAGSTQAVTSSLIVNADITAATIDLTTKVTGTLPVANGGTGITSLGTGVATALGANVSGTGAICLASGSACAGGGGSGLVLIEQHSASSSATLNFTTCISGTYDQYVVKFQDILPVTTGQDFLFRVGNGSYDSSSNYYWATKYVRNDGAEGVLASGGGAGTAGSLFTSISNNSSTGGISGDFQINNPSGSLRKVFGFQVQANQAAGFFTGNGASTWDQTTTITQFQFYFAAGILSGTIRCYGLAK
jgi:hypothetical protein